MFFQGCELIRSLTNFTKSSAKFKPIEKIRVLVAKYTFLDRIVHSKWFDMVMLIIIFLNISKSLAL